MMYDFTEIISNRTNSWLATSSDPLTRRRIGGDRRKDPVYGDMGPVVQPNGDVLFRYIAPEAEEVKIILLAAKVKKELPLVKNEEGVFEGLLTYSLEFTGPRLYFVIVDGVKTLDTTVPTMFRMGKINNYVEIPDPAFDEFLIKNVPHGTLSYETYYSETVGNWQRCLVYTPYGYRHNSDKYPVIYLHHGGMENETTWMFAGKVPQIMDNLIAKGEAVASIVVTPECMPRLPDDGEFGMDGYISTMLNDLIPFIEKEYRVKDDKWNRAIAGNSWGSMISNMIGFTYPEIFGNIGLISGGMRCHDVWPELKQNHQLDWMIGHPEKVAEAYKVFFRSNGEVEWITDSPHEHPEDEAFLKNNGITDLPCYHRLFYPYGQHEWDTFRKGFADFAKLLFK